MSLVRAIDRKLLRDLAHLRGQVLAVSIIVACGVAILVMALGALNSLQSSQDAYYERYRFAQVFAQATRAPERLAREIRTLPGVRAVETRIVRMVTLDITGFSDPANALLVSIPDTGEPALNRIWLYSGRWPEPHRADEVIATKAFVEAHGFQPGDRVRAIINGRARDLTIVGVGDSPEFVYTLGPGTLLPDDRRFGVFWMRREALAAAFDLDGAFNDVALALGPDARESEVIAGLDGVLARYGGVGGYGRKDQLSHAFIDSEMNQLRNVARIIPPVFLIVSAVLLNAILTRLIATERQQIGLLKAFGYTRAEIAWHYVKLALAIIAIGILIGFGLGAALARVMTGLYADTFRFPELIVRLSPASFVWSAGAAALAAIIGALNAALAAARLEPAEAMVPAPPVAYRSGLLQTLVARLAGDEPTRMVLRHVLRWPLRAASTMLGVAASVALLVGTLFAFDSIDTMLEHHFHRTDNYDAAINFAEVRGDEAAGDIARLPGVLAVEPNRTAVARLSHGSRSERAHVIGLPAGGGLKRLFGADGARLDLPREGIVLSTQMAGMLGVVAGDTITLELLEGRRPTLDVTVSGLEQEYIAAPAYMEIGRLNALLMEGGAITGVYARLDPAQGEAFRRAVLDRPMIASVGLREAAIAAFGDTLEESISIMMTIYALIGGAIAAGVAYNAARITLTERGRELASLRVLGFTDAEVSYILLGELALLVVAALPAGCLAGYGLAWAVATSMATELFRAPLVIAPSTYGVALLVVMGATFGAALLVRRLIRRLDIIAVLKTRE